MIDKELAYLERQISKTELLYLKQQLWKHRADQGKRRREYITFWYRTGKKMKEYWEAVGDKNIEWFNNNCRCFFTDKVECPACQMKRLLSET